MLVSLPTLIGVSLLIFLVMRVLPGDPVSVVLGQESFRALSEADASASAPTLGWTSRSTASTWTGWPTRPAGTWAAPSGVTTPCAA